MKYNKLKEEQKALAEQIRQWKSNRKEKRRIELNLKQWEVQYKLYRLQDKYRHKHIAYCMLRGRTYEQIERKCEVSPDFNQIERIMGEYEQKQALCASA